MGKKFDEVYDAIYEAVNARNQVGGYLPGDVVKFRKNYKRSECYNAMNSLLKQDLDELVNSGLNIRVTQVGDKLANMSTNNQHKTADNIVITVAGDYGGGRHYSSFTVTPEMIDIVTSNDPSYKIPDQFIRDDKTNWKPEEYMADEKNITRVTDKGTGKYTPTSLKLAGESTRFHRDNENLSLLYELI